MHRQNAHTDKKFVTQGASVSQSPADTLVPQRSKEKQLRSPRVQRATLDHKVNNTDGMDAAYAHERHS